MCLHMGMLDNQSQSQSQPRGRGLMDDGPTNMAVDKWSDNKMDKMDESGRLGLSHQNPKRGKGKHKECTHEWALLREDHELEGRNIKFFCVHCLKIISKREEYY